MTDEEITKLIEDEEVRHKTLVQRLREKLAYNLGQRRREEDRDA